MAIYRTPDGEEIELTPLNFGIACRIEKALDVALPAIITPTGKLVKRMAQSDALVRYVYEVFPRKELKRLNITSYEAFASFVLREGNAFAGYTALKAAFDASYCEFMGFASDVPSGPERPGGPPPENP